MARFGSRYAVRGTFWLTLSRLPSSLRDRKHINVCFCVDDAARAAREMCVNELSGVVGGVDLIDVIGASCVVGANDIICWIYVAHAINWFR